MCGVALSADPVLLGDAEQAFEHFRKHWPRAAAIEANKKTLKEKYDLAKELYEKVRDAGSGKSMQKSFFFIKLQLYLCCSSCQFFCFFFAHFAGIEDAKWTLFLAYDLFIGADCVSEHVVTRIFRYLTLIKCPRLSLIHSTGDG